MLKPPLTDRMYYRCIFILFPQSAFDARGIALVKVSARRLVWDSRDLNGDRAALLEGSLEVGGRFDLIIASDCLFFKARLLFFRTRFIFSAFQGNRLSPTPCLNADRKRG